MKKNITFRLRVCSLLFAFTLLSFTPVERISSVFQTKVPKILIDTSPLSIVCNFKTTYGYGISNISANLVSSNPLDNQYTTNVVTGYFQFPYKPIGTAITITPTKDDNDLNGVTTYDLLLMSKHILGVDPLNTPYKIIAADVNKSGSVTTFDMVELRKVILGIYPTLPNNTSWRFIDNSFQFPDVNNPFSTIFPETLTATFGYQSQFDLGFIGFKVGDVNGNAIANFQTPTEERSAGVLYLETQDRTIEKGEIFTVNFKGSETVLGGQFTLKYENLDLVKVLKTNGISEDNFANFPAKNVLTCSFLDDNKGEFSMVFKAKKDGKLSKMFHLNSEITKVEAYNLEEAKMDIELKFNQNSGTNGTNYKKEFLMPE
jgi:hypothetical protein